MLLTIAHTTRYLYSLPARSNINELRLAPEETDRQTPGQLRLNILPGAPLQESRDLFGNLVHYFEVEESHEVLEITSETAVTTHSSADLPLRAMTVPLRERTAPAEDPSLHQFTTDSTFVQKDPATWREAVDLHLAHEKTWGALMLGLSDHIFATCKYREQLVHGMASASDVQRERAGTCQDFAHLMIGYCRALGLPARYLSGYLYDPGLAAARESDFIGSGATHAWVEIHVPGVGWVGIDPTNRRWVDEHYVSVATGRDYHDVAPVRGSLIGGGPERSIEVGVWVSAKS